MATDITRVLSADQLTPPMLVVGIWYPGGLADAIVLRLLGAAVMAGAGFVLGTAIGMVKAEDLSTSTWRPDTLWLGQHLVGHQTARSRLAGVVYSRSVSGGQRVSSLVRQHACRGGGRRSDHAARRACGL